MEAELSKVKVAFLGNMNNMNYCIVRYLRDNGIDAHLFLGDEFDHFDPHADDYSFTGFKEYIHQLDWHKIGHWKISKMKMRKDLADFRFIAATDRNIAYLFKAGIKIDLFVPHGGDIFHLPFYDFKYFPPKKYEYGAWYQAYHQKRGIQASKNILMDYMNRDFEEVFAKLNYRNNRIKQGFPAVYVPTYESREMVTYSECSPYVAKMKEFKKNYDLVIFNNSRLMWTNHAIQKIHYKGNDRLIRAIAKLRKEGRNIGLVLFKYGVDVVPTQNLIEELDLDGHVLWYETLNRKDIIPLMQLADIVSSEFENSWIMGGVITESFLTKKPLLAFRNDLTYSYYEKLYPMLNARTQEQIEDRIESYFTNPTEVKKMGEDAYRWFCKHFIEDSIQKITALIRTV